MGSSLTRRKIVGRKVDRKGVSNGEGEEFDREVLMGRNQ